MLSGMLRFSTSVPQTSGEPLSRADVSICFICILTQPHSETKNGPSGRLSLPHDPFYGMSGNGFPNLLSYHDLLLVDDVDSLGE